MHREVQEPDGSDHRNLQKVSFEMEIIAIEFPARRYHATPWDAHVNEGRIEWPPSPWRLLRALLAVGYNKLGWVDGPSEAAISALSKLSRSMPSYGLPRVTESHTRHYMPTKDKTAKVFDAFLRFNDVESKLYIRFEVNLDPEERGILCDLVEGLAYLGRAESWVDARLLTSDEISNLAEPLTWCSANQRGTGRTSRLLSPMEPDEFDSWRNQQVKTAADDLEKSEREKLEANGRTLTPAALKKIHAKANSNYPPDLISAMQLETATWQSQGWPQPPGSRWVDYSVPDSVFTQQPLTPLAAAPRPEVIEAVLLAIDGEGRSGTVRPLMLRALPLMELLHSESIRKATNELDFGNLPELTGKAPDGTVLHGHQHAHWLPLSLFGERRIDHVLVWCRDGFSSRAIASLSSVRWAYAKGIERLSVNLAGMGSVEQIARQLASLGKCEATGLAPLQTSCVWHSVTPLVLRKFVHKRGKKTPEGQIREELIQRGFDEPTQVAIWPSSQMVLHHLKGYILQRKQGKQQPPCAASWGATIDFAKPQQGPICLGYASHFGLGLFAATAESSVAD